MSDDLKIKVRRITAYTRGERVPIWGDPIAAFRLTCDAEVFVAAMGKDHVIEKGCQKVVGRDGHGYAILDALDRHEIGEGIGTTPGGAPDDR